MRNAIRIVILFFLALFLSIAQQVHAGNPIVWDFSVYSTGWVGNPQDWVRNVNLYPGKAQDGGYWWRVKHSDPWIDGPIFSANAASYRWVKIVMASTTDSSGQVFFRRSTDSGIVENRSVIFVVQPDGNTRTYYVDMRSNPNWNGTIVQLRIDPANRWSDYDNAVRINRIELTNQGPSQPPPPVTELQVINVEAPASIEMGQTARIDFDVRNQTSTTTRYDFVAEVNSQPQGVNAVSARHYPTTHSNIRITANNVNQHYFHTRPTFDFNRGVVDHCSKLVGGNTDSLLGGSIAFATDVAGDGFKAYVEGKATGSTKEVWDVITKIDDTANFLEIVGFRYFGDFYHVVDVAYEGRSARSTVPPIRVHVPQWNINRIGKGYAIHKSAGSFYDVALSTPSWLRYPIFATGAGFAINGCGIMLNNDVTQQPGIIITANAAQTEVTLPPIEPWDATVDTTLFDAYLDEMITTSIALSAVSLEYEIAVQNGAEGPELLILSREVYLASQAAQRAVNDLHRVYSAEVNGLEAHIPLDHIEPVGQVIYTAQATHQASMIGVVRPVGGIDLVNDPVTPSDAMRVINQIGLVLPDMQYDLNDDGLVNEEDVNMVIANLGTGGS